MKLLRLRKLHRWVALVVAVQVVLWAASGLAFAWLDHRAVLGEGLAEARPPPTLPATLPLLDPARLAAASGRAELRALSLRPVAGQWFYRLETAEGVELRRATDGTRVAIDEAFAQRLATAHYRGQGPLRALRRHAQSTSETRGLGATWEAAYDDGPGTRLYFSAADGSLAAVRTDTWRLRDVFWMLHTMDYRGRDDFNHPLIVVAGTAAAWVALTGFWLLFRVLRGKWGHAAFRRAD